MTQSNKSHNKHVVVYNSLKECPNVRFSSQHKGERVILFFRQHPVTQIRWILGALLLLFFPLILMPFLGRFISSRESIFVILFWYAGLYSFIFLRSLLWFFTVGIVTNERVIDIESTQILNRKMSDASNYDIVDISSRVTGFIPSLFNYGNIYIQTAGTLQNVEFFGVPNPDEIASVISKYSRIAHQKHDRHNH